MLRGASYLGGWREEEEERGLAGDEWGEIPPRGADSSHSDGTALKIGKNSEISQLCQLSLSSAPWWAGPGCQPALELNKKMDGKYLNKIKTWGSQAAGRYVITAGRPAWWLVAGEPIISLQSCSSEQEWAVLPFPLIMMSRSAVCTRYYILSTVYINILVSPELHIFGGDLLQGKQRNSNQQDKKSCWIFWLCFYPNQPCL